MRRQTQSRCFIKEKRVRSGLFMRKTSRIFGHGANFRIYNLHNRKRQEPILY